MGKKGAAKQTPAKREVGRPSSYRVEFCQAVQERAEILAEGATDTAIADALGVDVRTIYRWRDEHEDFAAACEAVKERANHRVEASLFKRGIGYSHPAVKIFMPAGAPAPIYADYTEHYPPETAAASLWLRNRDPARWRDRIEHTGADGGPIVVASALEEARRRAAIDVPFTPVSNQTQLPASAEKPLNEAKPSIADALKAKRQG